VYRKTNLRLRVLGTTIRFATKDLDRCECEDSILPADQVYSWNPANFEVRLGAVHLISDTLDDYFLPIEWVYLQTPDCGLGGDKRLSCEEANLKKKEMWLRKHLPV
jgi:hypothetical protein